jgi:Xaa-Pro aminopeptidase
MSRYSIRIEKLREALIEHDADVYIASPSTALRYLIGAPQRGDERFSALVLTRRDTFAIANVLYEPLFRNLPVAAIYWADGDDPYALLVRYAHLPLSGKAYVDDTMSARFLLPLTRLLPEYEFELGGGLVDGLRRYKSEEELGYIAKASNAADAALAATLADGAAWIGKTEAEFSARLSEEFKSRGMEDPWAIVAAGKNAADPHHMTCDDIIEYGNCLLVDYGCRCSGYFTDITRTVFFGEPPSEFVKIYETVLQAQNLAKKAVINGNTLESVDRAARDYIAANGYGTYFTHRTGHGIGLDMHEGASLVRGSEAPIETGMVFSIEPGIYLPGKFGVRIEDLIAVTGGGVRVLHSFPRELTVIM